MYVLLFYVNINFKNVFPKSRLTFNVKAFSEYFWRQNYQNVDLKHQKNIELDF